MVVQSALAAAKFARMPFRIVPPNQMEDIQWAGDRGAINLLMDAARSPRPDELGTSELVVLFGEYGSGKTNALKYLAQQLRQEKELLAYVISPHVTDKPTWADFVRGLFTRSFLKEDVVTRLMPLRRWIQREASKRAKGMLAGPDADDPDKLRDASEEQRKIIAQELLPDLPGFVDFIVDLCEKNDPPRQNRNWNYLTSKLSAKDGSSYSNQYNIPPEGVAGDYNATLILTSFVRLMTHSTDQGRGSGVVYVFIDEVEGFYDLRSESRLSMLKGLRDLFDSCTENLCIALAASASDASEMWGILDQPLMMRLSRQPIQLPQLTSDQAKEFLLDLMDQNRIPHFADPREWPFTQDGLDAFVQVCPQPLTPRRLTVSAQRLVFQKYAQKVSSGLGIDASDVSEFTDWMSA